MQHISYDPRIFCGVLHTNPPGQCEKCGRCNKWIPPDQWTLSTCDGVWVDDPPQSYLHAS
jgi:hypothetical protein